MLDPLVSYYRGQTMPPKKREKILKEDNLYDSEELAELGIYDDEAERDA